MSQREHTNPQPMRELEWLAQYFLKHGEDQMAQDIFEQVKALRHTAQNSLTTPEASEVINMDCQTSKDQAENV